MRTSNKHTSKKKAVKTKKSKYKYSRPEHLIPAYQTLVRIVRERDEMKCQFPGCKRRRFSLEVHHILPWSKAPKLRYEPCNCILLCSKCHAKITGHELAYAALLFQIVQNNTMKQEKKARGY